MSRKLKAGKSGPSAKAVQPRSERSGRKDIGIGQMDKHYRNLGDRKVKACIHGSVARHQNMRPADRHRCNGKHLEVVGVEFVSPVQPIQRVGSFQARAVISTDDNCRSHYGAAIAHVDVAVTATAPF
jgi:hypothetical protein